MSWKMHVTRLRMLMSSFFCVGSRHHRQRDPRDERQQTQASTMQPITQSFSHAPQRMRRSDLETIPEEDEEGAQHLSVQRRTPKERSMRGIFRRKTVESSQSTMRPSASTLLPNAAAVSSASSMTI